MGGTSRVAAEESLVGEVTAKLHQQAATFHTRTGPTVVHLVIGSCAKLDIDKIDFELLVGLYTDQDGRASSADNKLVWEVD